VLGAAQFIVVLGKKCLALKNRSFILIDETRDSLHPSLQLKFLNELAGYAPEGRGLSPRINIGLAHRVAEEIYSCFSAAKGSEIKRIEQTPRLAELLGRAQLRGISGPLGSTRCCSSSGRTSRKSLVDS